MADRPHFWHDLDCEYVGPPLAEARYSVVSRRHFAGGWFEEVGTSVGHTRLEPWRDATRTIIRSAHEAQLLRRQRLFVLRLKDGTLVDDPMTIDFGHYFPLHRPALTELLSAYAMGLGLGARDVFDE